MPPQESPAEGERPRLDLSAIGAGRSRSADRLELAPVQPDPAWPRLAPPSHEHGWPRAATPPSNVHDWESAQPVIPPDQRTAGTTVQLSSSLRRCIDRVLRSNSPRAD